MFEYLFAEVYERYGTRVTEQSLVYFHYGVVNGIRDALERVMRQTFPVSLDSIMEATTKEMQLLAKAEFYVEKEYARPWLYPLVDSIARIKKVELQPQAMEYVNRLIVTASNAILSVGARVALETRPHVGLIFPEDLETACIRIFGEKWWFLC